jgi:endonuclease III
MVPELRAERLKEIVTRVRDQYGGDLRAALAGPIAQARKILKSFPSIADPGADRILLFAAISPIAAVPSNCPHVLIRIVFGLERENYSVNYRDGQRVILDEIPQTFEARQRAFLLLKQHGQGICKTKNPKCAECPVSRACAYFAGHNRGTRKSAVPGSRR